MDLRREAGPQVQYSRLHVWGGFTPLGEGGVAAVATTAQGC